MAIVNLISEFGRRDRAAVIARAKELHARMGWDAAMAQAHREASDELRARFNRHTTVPSISAQRSQA